MPYPDIRLMGSMEGGLIITAAMPPNLDPSGKREQILTLTPHQSRELVRKIALAGLFKPTPEEAVKG